jgi:hypothetical protein
MWGDIENANNPPDANGSNFPILWTCEIKYVSFSESAWDLDKLRLLVRHGKARYGCWLHMHRVRAKSGNGIVWKKDEEDGRIWVCHARLPALAMPRGST